MNLRNGNANSYAATWTIIRKKNHGMKKNTGDCFDDQ